MKYNDCGFDAIKDRYLQCQIFNLTHQVSSFTFKEKAAKQSFGTFVDFFWTTLYFFS